MRIIRTLLVDDNMRFLDSVQRYLGSTTEASFACVGKVSTGEEAIKLSTELKPDLVLMDLTMPGMGGLVATRLLKQIPDPPRVIILTIHEYAAYRNAALEAGADDFVTKSDFAEKLIPIVKSLFPDTTSAALCLPHPQEGIL